jgi:hypothetical protein
MSTQMLTYTHPRVCIFIQPVPVYADARTDSHMDMHVHTFTDVCIQRQIGSLPQPAIWELPSLLCASVSPSVKR